MFQLTEKEKAEVVANCDLKDRQRRKMDFERNRVK